MPHRHVRTLFLATALAAPLLVTPPARAEDCSIVSLEQVSAALPDYQPWVMRSGGAGSCRFEGEIAESDEPGASRSSVTLDLMQQFHPSRKAAADTMRTFRTEYAKTYAIKPLTVRGAEPGAFTYRAKGGAPLPGFWWYAQVGRGVLSGIFMPPPQMESGDEDEAAVVSLLQSAVADTANPATAAKAARCTHFDEAIVKKLIPGKSLTIEQYGENSCMAKNEKNAVVMVSRITDVDPTRAEQISSSQGAFCTVELVPTLGELGRIEYRCTVGAKMASVHYFNAKDQAYFDFSVVPNGEPTAQQRADLIKLAQQRYAR